MSTIIRTHAAPTTTGTDAAAVARYAINVGEARCEVRARTIAMIAEVLGFEQEMEDAGDDLAGMTGEAGTIADLLDSRMIAPPRPLRRRQRAVSSRAVFYGQAGGG